MTRNRFNQANTISQSSTTNDLSASKAHQFLLEDNDNIDIKYTYEITKVHTSIEKKEVVNNKYGASSLLSSSNKRIFSIKIISELKKV